jgi:Ice-binding-like
MAYGFSWPDSLAKGLNRRRPMLRALPFPRRTALVTVMVALAVYLCTVSSASTATSPPLGGAASFAVLAGSVVNNTGSSVVYGNLGISPGVAVIGFPPGVVVPPGTIHDADAVAAQAQSDLTTAYNNAAGQVCDINLTGQDLGGVTLTPSVYCFRSSAQLTGMLTLDAQGNPNAVFIFQIGSTLMTASNSSVLLTNSASACNVYWQVGSSATLGNYTQFAGNILELVSITLNTGASVSGRALALTGAVTLDANKVSNAGCPGAPPLPVFLPLVAR